MSDINVTNNAQESFCEAVDWIVTDAIARHPSDITLDGVITDVSKKANYRYRVKTTEAEFDAYALEGTSYHKNDSVLIHVPMGNFNNQKTILGRKSDGDAVNEIFAFKLPFDDFVALRSLNEEGAIETNRNKAFWANYNSNKYIKNTTNAIENESTLNIEIEQKSTADSLDEILLWQWNYGSSNFGTTIGNTRLGIEADWQTFLGDYNPIAGVYGFHIVVTGRAVNQESILTKDYFFTNADMYGNTYAFYTPYSQQKVLDISEFCNIHDVKIYFYQDYNFISATMHVGKIWYDDFKLITENSIEYYVPNMPENILVDNINVFLGITTADIKDEKTYLYSYDPLSYTTIKKRRGIVEGEEHIYIENQNNEWECETTKELLTEENPTDIQTFYECTSDHDLIFTWVHYAKDEGMTFQVVKNIEDLKKQRANSNKDTHIFWYVYNYDNEVQNSDLKLFPYQYWDEEEQVYKFHTEETGYHTNYQEFYDNLIDSRENKSYISKIELYGGEGWTFIPSQTDKFNWENFNPRADKSREKIKVVVQHHGTHTTSEVMVLNNTRDIEQELAATARNDAFLIKCFKVREVDGKLLAVEDSSLNAFHIYDENNQILHNDQGERYDYEKLYLQIHIKDEDTGTYQLFNTFDEENATNLNRMISWLIPDNCSMIESQYPISPEDAVYFTNNLEFRDSANNITTVAGEIDIDSPSYKNFYAATRRFTIKSILNNRYQNNIVNAIITYNNEQYYLQKDLMFGRAEGEGHEFVPVIELIQPYNASNIICDEAFMVGCVVYNKDGSIFRPSDTHLLRFEWKELGQHTYFTPTPNSNSEEDIIFTPKLFDEHKNALIGSYSEMVSRLELTQENESLKNKYHRYDNNVICGYINRGEDQTYGYSPIFEVTVSGAADYDITVRKAFPIITYPNNVSKEQNYIFTVPTRVEFKSDGTKPVYYDSIFSVQEATDDDNKHEEVFNEIIISEGEKINTDEFKADEWELKDNLEENATRIFILQPELKDTKILAEDRQETTSIYSPKKKYYYTYKLVPNLLSKDGAYADIDEIKRRISWTPELLSNYYYLVWQKNGTYFTQALAFSRSLYSSSLVNEWDGTTLTWDEENGSILSTMIAAGKKDNHNRFTGVMMGDWSTKGDESLDTPGMYGYKNGAQTFGFKTDGSGFIGNAGSGRIEFDGKNALISNSTKTCYMNLNPGADRGYSDNFIYCQIPRSAENESNFNTQSSGIEYETSWANSYVKDADNDYFIVDPAHGILTTGGLVARYGKIGNWMINNEGLYQTANNGYMYLGFDASDINIATIFKTMKNDLEIAQTNIASNINHIINYNNNTLDQCYYKDLLRELNQNFSQKILTDDFELLIGEEQDKINNNNNLITNTYNIDKNWISTGKKAKQEERLSFNILYDIYIKDNSLNYYNLKDKLKELLVLYDADLIFDTLIEYLDSFNDNKENDYYNLYNNFISTLEAYPSHQYKVELKEYDKYIYDTENKTHIKQSVEKKIITSNINSHNIYLNNFIINESDSNTTLKEDYLKVLNQFQSELNDINSNINSLNKQLENDIEAFLSSNTGSFSENDQEKFDKIVNQLALLDNIQNNFSLQNTNYNNLLSEINILIADKELIMAYYNNLRTVQQDINDFQESINEYNGPITECNQKIEAKNAEIKKEKDEEKLAILQTEKQQLENELESLQTSQDQLKSLKSSKEADLNVITTQIQQLLLKYNIASDTLPEQSTINQTLNLKISNMIQSTKETSGQEKIQFNEYSDIFKLLILNSDTDNEINSIEELWQQIDNLEQDDFIGHLLQQYQSFKNTNGTLDYNFKTIWAQTDYTEIEENIITNNANILQQCENNLNIINQILVRKRQLIFNNYSSVDIPEWITTNQNTFNILRENYITIQNKINEINNDLVYINKIYDFYNTLLLVIDKKISLLQSNNISYQKKIDIRISDLMITFDAIINILFNDTIGIVSTTNTINTYIQKINEQQQMLINTNIYTRDECNNYIKNDKIYQWKTLDWNQFKTQVIQQSIKENLKKFKEDFRTLLSELKSSILNQDKDEIIQQKKNNIKSKYQKFYELLLLNMDQDTEIINIEESTKNAYNNILNNIINNIQNILLNRINDYLNTLSATTTYAIYVSDIDPNLSTAIPNPYFSVSRDGTMFARKGIIANTWTINDYSLTYEKNSDKIYLGQGLSKYNSGVANGYLLSEGIGWSFSAGITDSDQNYNVNFGVTTDGQMYSNSGQIGKWYISDHTLQGKPKDSSTENGNYLILDAKDNTIKAANEAFIIDGSTGEIYLGRYLTHIAQTAENEEEEENTAVTYIDTVIGNMYLASFLMSGRTVFERNKDNQDIDFDYIKHIITSQSTQNTSVGGSTENYGWGTVSLGSETIGASTGVSSQHISYGLDVNNCSYLQFLDKNHDYKGAILAVGKNSQDSTGMEENVTVFYPASSQHSVLGINTRRWDLFANYIDVGSLYATGINCKEEIRMLEGELVATQPWVRDQLYDLWNAVGDLNNAAGAASRKSNAQSIIGAQWIGQQGSNGGYCIGIRFTRGNNSTFDSNTSGELSGAYHGHRIELKRVGTSLQATATTYSGTGSTAYGPTESIDHTHPLTGSFSDGTFTVKLGGADFSKTMSSPYTYDVRTSTWYSGRLQHLWSGVAIGSGTGPNNNNRNSSIKIILKRNSVDGISFSDRTVYSATGALASYYDNAYKKGYKDGAKAAWKAVKVDTSGSMGGDGSSSTGGGKITASATGEATINLRNEYVTIVDSKLDPDSWSGFKYWTCTRTHGSSSSSEPTT